MSRAFSMNMDHIVILVSDMDASMRFYEALLPMIGFAKTRPQVFGNAQGIYLDFRQAKLLEHGYERYAPGLNHMGFVADSLADIEAIHAMMEERGFTMPAIQNLSGDMALFVKDPDGMRIEITHYAPSNDGEA